MQITREQKLKLRLKKSKKINLEDFYMSKGKKTFSLVDYLTFIYEIYNKVTVAGIEFKTFFTAVVTADMFFDYDVFGVVQEETGNKETVDYARAWELLSNYKVVLGQADADEREMSMIDFVIDDNYCFYDDKAFTNMSKGLSLSLFTDMMKTLDKKLDLYFSVDDSSRLLNQSLTSLTESLDNLIKNVDEELKGMNIEEVLPILNDLKDTFSNLDTKTVSKVIAKHAIENKGKGENE